MTDKLFKGKLLLAPTWRVQCVTEEKPWRQDLQATGHIASAAREFENKLRSSPKLLWRRSS